MTFRLSTIALIAAPAFLVSCAGVDTSQWPDPDTVGVALSAVESAYAADCAVQPKAAWCSAKAQAQAQNCETAANAGLATYTEAYQTGNVTQAVLDNEAQLVPALVTCIAKVKKGE